MTATDNILIGYKTGEMVTVQKGLVLIGDRVDTDENNVMIIGETLMGKPISDEFRQAMEDAGRENAAIIISMIMRSTYEFFRDNLYWPTRGKDVD